MIPQQTPVKNHWGNNSNTIFDFDFYIENEEQITVTHTDLDGNITTPVLGVDYSITSVGNIEGSNITFPIAGSTYSILAWDTGTNKKELLSIALNLPIEQPAEYSMSGDLNKKNLEKSLDYLTRLLQIYNRALNRAVKIQEGSNVDTDTLAVNLNKVADIASDVSAVAGNNSNVSIVADSITNVNKVGIDIENVNNVATDLSSIDTVKNNLTNIDTVATNISDVNAIGESITNVNAVAADLTNIDTVVDDLSSIGTVAENISYVNTVGANISDIYTVRGNISSIRSVAGNISGVSAVAADLANIDAVVADLSNINAVKYDLTNIDAVKNHLQNINAVAADLTNIDNVRQYTDLAEDWATKMNGTVDGSEYSAKYYAQQAAQGQVQVNWNENNPTSKSYIQNKPLIPTATSQIQNNTNLVSYQVNGAETLAPVGFTSDGETFMILYVVGDGMGVGGKLYDLVYDGTYSYYGTITAAEWSENVTGTLNLTLDNSSQIQDVLSADALFQSNTKYFAWYDNSNSRTIYTEVIQGTSDVYTLEDDEFVLELSNADVSLSMDIYGSLTCTINQYDPDGFTCTPNFEQNVLDYSDSTVDLLNANSEVIATIPPNIVTSVNNIQPVDGNVTITIPDTSSLADDTLSNVTTIDSNSAVQTALNGKQNTISDLATIRSGASAGATAVQPSTLTGYVAKSEVTYDSTTSTLYIGVSQS